MNPSPFLGVVLHWLGGLASGSFYVPYKAVRKWSWETYWLVGGIFSWVLCPWAFAYFMTNDLFGVIGQQSARTLAWTYLFGLLWGFGGLTYGLTMRYLGLSLGTGVALGFCAAFGTLVPPVFKWLTPNFFVFAESPSILEVVQDKSGIITLGGVATCLLGIGIAALAGYTKESEMPAAQKKESIKEFDFKKGILVATFCGIMSACFAFALQAGKSMDAASLAAGTDKIWTGLPTLPILLLGGFTTNFIWCTYLNIKNRSGYQYLAQQVRPEHAGLQAAGGEHSTGAQVTATTNDLRVPRASNYFFSALAGTTWYFQFFFYTMGATQMGKFDFASWTLHMASIIIFATIWGWIFKEWKGSSKKAHGLIAAGVVTLILSTIIIGWGTYLKGQAGGH
ncbi:MAG TPA: L-rhamnose/proton symporter RhaT [Verrucomicrobiae bacterium]|nr:L-rhamnose/proton symporter RhaT [Verrucomicrobiae bacterium]